jgi:hypothetical protein
MADIGRELYWPREDVQTNTARKRLATGSRGAGSKAPFEQEQSKNLAMNTMRKTTMPKSLLSLRNFLVPTHKTESWWDRIIGRGGAASIALSMILSPHDSVIWLRPDRAASFCVFCGYNALTVWESEKYL